MKRHFRVGVVLPVLLAAIMVGLVHGAVIFKVGMVTDSGTIDDKSFNQGLGKAFNGLEKSLSSKPDF